MIVAPGSTGLGENMITAAQEWFNEGFNEGLLRQIEIIENFLKAGVTWDIVYEATDFDENSFHELKKTLTKVLYRTGSTPASERCQAPILLTVWP